MLVAMNKFAYRHTLESSYSNYAGSFTGLCLLVEKNLHRRVVIASDEDGEVIKITLTPADGLFYTNMIQAQPGIAVNTYFESRNPDEYPFFQFRASPDQPQNKTGKVPAIETDIILYSHSKLARKGENSTSADWEIVSINAKRIAGHEPPHLVAMMRNQKGYPGGTKMEYTPEQWADAVEFWLGGGPQAPFIALDNQ